VRICQCLPELQHSVEIQYGGQQPSWIPHNANFEVNLSTEVAFCLCLSNFVKSVDPFPSYAIFSKSSMACGGLHKNSPCRVVFWGGLAFPGHKRNCWMLCTPDGLTYNKPRRFSYRTCKSVDRCGLGVACSVAIGIWLEFPLLGGHMGYLTPKVSPDPKFYLCIQSR
jgi:hypothetical protein